MITTISSWSKKKRMSFITLAIFLISIWSLTLYANRMLREDMQRVLGQQQLSTVALAAAEVNLGINDRLKTLERIASSVTPAMMSDTDVLQAYLEQSQIFQSMFNAGIFVTGIDGTPIADVPVTANRLGRNVKERDYIVAALKEGRASIGRPVIGKSLSAPVFSMAAPIRNAQGQVIGVMVGVTDLTRPHFMDNITENHYGKTGGYLIVSRLHRQIITGTDKSRIMEVLPPSGINPAIDRAMQGQENSEVSVTPQGVSVLASTKGIPVPDWYMVALLPTSEAFAAINAMQQRLLLAAFVITLLAGSLAWWLVEARQVSKTLEVLVEEQTEELRESEKKHRILFEYAGDAILIHNADGMLAVNPLACKRLGYSQEELMSLPPEKVDAPEHRRFLQERAAALKEQDYITFETVHLSKDGSEMPTEVTASNIVWEEHPAILAICRDITERKQTEQDVLRENNSRFDQLAELSRTMIWEVNAEGLFTYVNHVSETVFGYLPDEIVGRMHIYDLFPESEQEVVKKILAGHFERREQLLNMENHTVTKDGRQIWWTTNGIPVLSNDGTLLGYRGSDTDITESKKLKEQLQRSQKMQAVGQLAGGLAHDFNNVLSIINGYCSLLSMEMQHTAVLDEYMKRIMAASGRAGELTHSMLAFSRTQVMNPQKQNMSVIVSNVGSLVEKIIGDNINFKTVINEATLLVNVDAGQIEQVLINLANNARDAMPDGGDLTISTEIVTMDAGFIAGHGFGKQGRYSLTTITDTGTGMNDVTREKIFEPFFTTKEVDKGTGLGLAMVYGIVSQHRGFVDVTSSPGCGASFRLYLPIVESETAVSASEATAGAEVSTGTETILIAEDNADLREFMNTMLTRLGYRVILAVDGQDAVEKFTANADSIQLIVMDMVMPRKSGKAAYDEIKEIRPDARALFSSGYSANIIQQQGELGKNAEFIAKPVQPAALLRKVREMLDR